MGYESCKLIKSLMDGQACEFDNDSGSVLIHTDEVDKYAAERGIEVS